jgi:hypothetical protein
MIDRNLADCADSRHIAVGDALGAFENAGPVTGRNLASPESCFNDPHR